MNLKQTFTAIFMSSSFSMTAFAAQPHETVITYKIINKGNSTIESHLPDASRVQPNSSATFSTVHDLKISSMRRGDSRSQGQSFLFVSGNKLCEFGTSISLTKTGEGIDYATSHHANSRGKEPASCELSVVKEQNKAPYSYNLELVMH